MPKSSFYTRNRDVYLTKWYKWGYNKIGPKPQIDLKYAPAKVTNERYEEQLLSGKYLLNHYHNLILNLVKHPPFVEQALWDEIARSIVNEPRKKDPIKDKRKGKEQKQNKGPIQEDNLTLGPNERYVIMAELYAELCMEFFEAVLRFDPAKAAFSTYIKADLSEATKRLVKPLWPYQILLSEPYQVESNNISTPISNVKEAMTLIKSVLTEKQLQVFKLAMYDNVPDTYASEILAVSQPAISKTVATIRRKLKAEPIRSKLLELLAPPESDLRPLSTRKPTKVQ